MSEDKEILAKDGQHQHSARTPMDLTLGEDFQTILRQHFKMSRGCFSLEGWPMQVDHPENEPYPCRGKVVCLVCKKMIGECTIEGVQGRSNK